MNDMTKGSPLKNIVFFLIPVLLGNLFQHCYNIADTVIVGRFLGVDALAAVGATGAITFLVIGWISGLTSGFGILIAQAFGSKDVKLLKHYVAMSSYICIGFAIIMTAGLLLANEWILMTMNTPDSIIGSTKLYIGIIYAGLPATILYNMLAALARAIGDSKTPLYFLALSSIINIGLDFYLVGSTTLGVAGAAIATVISQGLSGVLCLVYLYKKYELVRFTKAEAVFKWTSFIKLMGIGVPMALQFSITAIGTMIVQSALNLLGAVHIAAFSASMKIQNIMMQIYVALAASIANFVAQNFGAGELVRVKKGVNVSIGIVLVYSIIMMTFAYYIAPGLVNFFAEDVTGELERLSQQVFHISMWFYLPLGLIFVYRNALQGLGNGIIPMLGGVFELFARGLGIILLFNSLQFIGVCLTDPFAWIAALIPLIPYYYWYMKKVEKQL